MKIVDARGLSCPEPVMLTEDALKGRREDRCKSTGDRTSSENECRKSMQKTTDGKLSSEETGRRLCGCDRVRKERT